MYDLKRKISEFLQTEKRWLRLLFSWLPVLFGGISLLSLFIDYIFPVTNGTLNQLASGMFLWSIMLSAIWFWLIHWILRKNHPAVRWMCSAAYFFFPAILMFMVISIPGGSHEEQHQRNKCLANVKMLNVALQLYAADNNDRFPDDLEKLFPDYFPESEREILHCPGERDKKVFSSYKYYGKGKLVKGPSFVILQEMPGNHQHNYCCLAMSDGHCFVDNPVDTRSLPSEQ